MRWLILKNKLKCLKSLKLSGSLSDNQYKIIRSVGCRPGILYDPCKAHKTVDICLPFRPILSAIGRLTCKIGKFVAFVLNCVTVHEFTLSCLPKKLLNTQ